MRPRTTQSQLTSNVVRLISLVFCLGLWAISTPASESRVVARQNIERVQREVLAAKLRIITGWRDLSFDQYGFLQLGLGEPSTGSASARKLLSKAVLGSSFIVIEDASSRSDVVFCRVVQAQTSGFSTAQPLFVVLIDFVDFEKVMGDRLALAAFDVGWAFLHEVDHLVKESHDPTDTESAVGDCEDSVNQMRREVGLPVRMDYFFSSLPFRPDPQLVSRLVRMRFEQLQEPNKVKRYWVIWDAAVVGGLPKAD